MTLLHGKKIQYLLIRLSRIENKLEFEYNLKQNEINIKIKQFADLICEYINTDANYLYRHCSTNNMLNIYSVKLLELNERMKLLNTELESIERRWLSAKSEYDFKLQLWTFDFVNSSPSTSNIYNSYNYTIQKKRIRTSISLLEEAILKSILIFPSDNNEYYNVEICKKCSQYKMCISYNTEYACIDCLSLKYDTDLDRTIIFLSALQKYNLRINETKCSRCIMRAREIIYSSTEIHIICRNCYELLFI
jgi:hypothetical protein